MRTTALVVLASVALSGCGHIKDAIDPGRVTRREQAARDKQAAEDAAARQRAEEAAQEAEMDRLCLQAETPYQVNFCAAREREKDRAAMRQQWARENQIREQQLEIQRIQVEADRKERRRRALETCTSTISGDTVRTNCY